MTSDGLLTSGRLAKTAGVNRETIRFYERGGLMPAPSRTDGGYRVYHPSDVRRLQFILRSKSLGFSLAEIKELLSIADGRLVRCASVKRIAEHRLKQIDRQIADLNRLRGALRSLVNQCSKGTHVGDCPIIDALTVQGEGPNAH